MKYSINRQINQLLFLSFSILFSPRFYLPEARFKDIQKKDPGDFQIGAFDQIPGNVVSAAAGTGLIDTILSAVNTVNLHLVMILVQKHMDFTFLGVVSQATVNYTAKFIYATMEICQFIKIAHFTVGDIKTMVLVTQKEIHHTADAQITTTELVIRMPIPYGLGEDKGQVDKFIRL